MPRPLTFDDFLPLRNTRFELAEQPGYALELTEVRNLSNARLDQFSLTFAGVLSPSLPQGVYRLAHPQLSECELFLVPSGPSAGSMCYEASFSRFLPEAAPPSAAV
jgi:hypothetical protein